MESNLPPRQLSPSPPCQLTYPRSSEVKKVGGIGQILHFLICDFLVSGGGGGGRKCRFVRGSVSSPEIIPGCKAVLKIGGERAAELLHKPGQQVLVKQVKDDVILVGFDLLDAWVNAEEVSIMQAGTQPVSKVGVGGGGRF